MKRANEKKKMPICWNRLEGVIPRSFGVLGEKKQVEQRIKWSYYIIVCNTIGMNIYDTFLVINLFFDTYFRW